MEPLKCDLNPTHLIPVGNQVYVREGVRVCINCAIRQGLHINPTVRVMVWTTTGLVANRPGNKPSFTEDEPETPCEGPTKGWEEKEVHFPLNGWEADQKTSISQPVTPDEPGATKTTYILDGWESEPAYHWQRQRARAKEREAAKKKG